MLLCVLEALHNGMLTIHIDTNPCQARLVRHLSKPSFGNVLASVYLDTLFSVSSEQTRIVILSILTLHWGPRH